jgi:hypothetical protein
MTLLSCIYFFSFINAIDPNVTKAIIQIESSGNQFAIGKSHGEHGLMQIRPQFVVETKQQLFNSCTNVMVGTRILGQLKEKCKLCVDKTYVNGYNLGERGAKKLKHPKLWKYHKKVIAMLEK